MKIQSNALWPKKHCFGKYGSNITTDIHPTETSAKIVCDMLETEGLGGASEIYPIKTWVSEVQQPPVLPKE